MKTNFASSEEALERYAIWERSAGTTLAILVVVVAASLYVHVPSALFAAGNLLSGIMIFFAWRSGMKKQTAVTLVLILIAVVTSLLALSIEIQQPIQVLLSQGLGMLAATLFACIFAARSKVNLRGPKA